MGLTRTETDSALIFEAAFFSTANSQLVGPSIVRVFLAFLETRRQDTCKLTVCVTCNPFIMTRSNKHMKTPSTSLVHVLVGKSIAETLLVGALAVFTFMTVFPPYFQGWGDVTETSIAGWAVNSAEPWARVEVQLFIDGQFIAQTVANKSRTDVLAAGWSKDEWHGYTFPITGLNPGRHEARVYALHDSGEGERKSLQLLGDPISFLVDSDRNLTGGRQ